MNSTFVVPPPPEQSLNASFDLTVQDDDDPVCISERSLGDAPLTDTVVVDEDTTYEIVESGTIRRCRKLIATDGYSYTVKSSNPTTTQWRCAVRNRSTWCRASVSQRGTTFTPGSADHIHPPDHSTAMLVRVKKQIWEDANAQPFTSAQTIVEEKLQANVDDDDFDLPKPANLIRRRGSIPTSPRRPVHSRTRPCHTQEAGHTHTKKKKTKHFGS
ncbi:uncharacterized protein LOC117333761 isoform X1 [Pecten maximus]|uniref:uncharacterized protein LOC117333761 isoform X1 n=1 Tax=Pecten maximus TaxID=6579 RepID=UPI0014588745|nr:uncharacterized protein LOC117333761 isoform X1 [Pecten maximus]